LNSTVSVIVRTVRRPQRLLECLQSLAAQTLRNFELILVDMSDGSISTIVEEMRAHLPAVRHLRLNGACSRPVALNRGIELARGDLITILDDDNLWDPDHLEKIVRDFNGADLVYTGVRVQTLTVAGEMMHERIHQLLFDFSRLLEGNYIFTVATAFRRSLWDDVGHYDERFPVYEDWEFLIRATHGREVRALTCCSAISRAFTGDVHLREHSANEADECARCRAALQWKHRGLRNQRAHDFKNARLLAQWWWQNRFAFLRA
jgi:glycosyltransferase involved in cell wall biosynthesis